MTRERETAGERLKIFLKILEKRDEVEKKRKRNVKVKIVYR